MRFVNDSQVTVSLPMLGIPTVLPGEFVEIDDSLCKPGRTDNGSRRKSPIEMYAPHLKPADPEIRAEWEKIPEPRKPVSAKVTSENMRARPSRGLPPGVQAAMLAKATAEATAAANPAPPAPETAPAPTEPPPPPPAPLPAPVKPPAPAKPAPVAKDKAK